MIPYKANFEAARTVAFGSVGAAYAALGAVLAFDSAILLITNTLDNPIWISFDGINDHIYLPAATGLLHDILAGKMEIYKGTQIYIKHAGAAATAGLLALSSIYRT